MSKTALITGGNSGIGYATAKLLNEKKYTVFISGRSSERICIAADKLNVESIVADMGDLKAIERMASGFQNEGLDVLINNAAVLSNKPISMYEPEDYKNAFNINIRGPIELIKNLIPALEKKGGSVTNISSIVAATGMPHSTVYSATKGAIEAATRSLAAELAPKNIRINAIRPGAIDTPIYDKAGMASDDVMGLKEFLQCNTPLKRFGTPDELARVILSQLESEFTTGAVWVVDGGFSAALRPYQA